MKDKKKISTGLRLFYLVVVVLNIIAASVLLLGGVSPLINPTMWAFPAYIGLFFPIFLGVQLLFLIFWTIVRKSWFFFSLAVLLVVSCPIYNTIAFSVSKKRSVVEGKEISILSYNTMANASFVKPTAKKANPILDYILKKNADIVCLQEFGVSKKTQYLTIKDVFKILKQYPYQHISYRIDDSKHRIGIATFSKFPIVKKQEIVYESTFNISHYSDIVIEKDTIRIINNHLESNRLTEQDITLPTALKEPKELGEYAGYLTAKLDVAYAKRSKQADIVALEVKNSPYRTIVCGDFNDVPVSYTYQTIKGELKDAFVERGNGFGTTYHEKSLLVRIDYILYSNKIDMIDFRRDKIKYSDHYPISCRAVIKP